MPTERHLQIRYGSAHSDIAIINAGIPQGGIFYIIFIFLTNQPLIICNDPLSASESLQNHLVYIKLVHQMAF